MKNTGTHYFKNPQAYDLWNYYKVICDRKPPGCEVICFLNEHPTIQFREYDLLDYKLRMEYNAFWEHAEPIDADEYHEAYLKATSGQFSLLINGRLL